MVAAACNQVACIRLLVGCEDPDRLCGARSTLPHWANRQTTLSRSISMYLTRWDEEQVAAMAGLTALEIASRLGHAEAAHAIVQVMRPGRMAATRIQAAWWARKGPLLCEALSDAYEARVGQPPPDDVVLQVVGHLLPAAFRDALRCRGAEPWLGGYIY